jgi:hypothetical protein
VLQHFNQFSTECISFDNKLEIIRITIPGAFGAFDRSDADGLLVDGRHPVIFGLLPWKELNEFL